MISGTAWTKRRSVRSSPPAFAVERVEYGTTETPNGNIRASAWFWLRRASDH